MTDAWPDSRCGSGRTPHSAARISADLATTARSHTQPCWPWPLRFRPAGQNRGQRQLVHDRNCGTAAGLDPLAGRMHPVLPAQVLGLPCAPPDRRGWDGLAGLPASRTPALSASQGLPQFPQRFLETGRLRPQPIADRCPERRLRTGSVRDTASPSAREQSTSEQRSVLESAGLLKGLRAQTPH